MSLRNIALVTSFGPELGFGHVQRMAALLELPCDEVIVTLTAPSLPPFLDGETVKKFTLEIPPAPDLIIRDMRDSTAVDIRELQKRAPVLVIDDHGAGRKSADHVIDLLPHPSRDSGTGSGLFLYGYSFMKSLGQIHDEGDRSGIGCYAGVLARDPRFRELMAGLVRDHGVVFMGSAPEGFTSRRFGDPAPVFFSKRVIITYFGITMYEALLSGCAVVTVSPSAYHDELTRLAGIERVVNAGTIDDCTGEKLHEAVDRALALPLIEKSPRQTLMEAKAARERFIEAVLSL